MKFCFKSRLLRETGLCKSAIGKRTVLISPLVLATLITVALANQPIVGPKRDQNRVVPPGPVVTTGSAPARTAAGIGASAAPSSDGLPAGDLQLSSKCAIKSSCSRRTSTGSKLETDASVDKLVCHCDQLCRAYDDCCHDSRWAEPTSERARLTGTQVRQRRHRDWHCKKVNSIFGDVLLKARCHPDWPETEQAVRRKCEMASMKMLKNSTDYDAIQSDPMGGLMPITDPSSGVTYANSHCLRCNTIMGHKSKVKSRPKLIYWSPLVTCSYNLDSDDRNTLYDLISNYQGQALKYSAKRNKWLIVNATETGTSKTHNLTKDSGIPERECQIVPSIPDSAEHLIRFCHSKLIDYCPSDAKHRFASLDPGEREESLRNIFECEHGHQALVYSQTSSAVYYNLACAKCHNERNVFCEPKRRKDLKPESVQQGVTKSNMVTNTDDGRLVGGEQFSATVEDEEEFGLGGEAARSGGSSVDIHSTVGSFSVLLDLAGAFQSSGSGTHGDTSSSGGPQVGALHLCEDSEGQVYDPILQTCRDIVCGLNHRFIEGSCVEEPHSSGSKDRGLDMNSTGTLTGYLISDITAKSSTGSVAMAKQARIESNAPTPKFVGEAESEEGSTPASTTVVSTSEQRHHQSHSHSKSGSNILAVAQKDPYDKGSSATSGKVSEHIFSSSGVSSSAGQFTNGSRAATSSGRFFANEHAAQKDQARPTEAKLVGGDGDEAINGFSIVRQTSITANAINESLANYSHMLPPSVNDLPRSDAKSLRQFAECGKILISPEHYRLFTKSEFQTFMNLTYSSGESSEKNPKNHSQTSGNSVDDMVWALVLPYNLTLSQSEFELVRQKEQELAKPSFNLLICSPFKSDLVSKFHPAMAHLTTGCLIISIASLVCYLVLYLISMIDLGALLVEMTRAANTKGRKGDLGCRWCWFWSSSPLATRGSRASNESACQSTRSKSLSSRGVACLSGSLLAAYLLFIIGHQQQASEDLADGQARDLSGRNSCALIATGTYYFFLLAFNWMFLLSYDIWRTLRLATCRFRAPSTHSQSGRFVVYAACAFFTAGVTAALVFSLDHVDLNSASCSSGSGELEPPCSALWIDFEQFVHNYRPKFGHRPGSCWFTNKRSLALFFGLPVTFIMVLNLIFFLHSSFMVIKTSSRSSRKAPYIHPNGPSTVSSGLAESSDDKQPSAKYDAHNQLKVQISIATNLDFTQQNNLTTSSLTSVKTIQSNLDISPVIGRRRDSIDSTSTSTSLHQQDSTDSGQSSISGQSNGPLNRAAVSDAQFPETRTSKIAFATHTIQKQNDCHQPAGILCNSKQSPKIGTKKANILNKCDEQLNQVSALVASLIKDYRLYCRLSTIMGLTWLTGLIASMVDQSELLWYLFTLLNTLQGLFIFIAFGLKRSKLTNLSILLCYISYKFSQTFERFDKGELHQDRKGKLRATTDLSL